MTTPTDEELDKLVEQQTRAANKRDEFEALMNADRTVRAITALRTQLAEARAAPVTLADALQVPEVEALISLIPEVIASLDATRCNVSLTSELCAALRAVGRDEANG